MTNKGIFGLLRLVKTPSFMKGFLLLRLSDFFILKCLICLLL